MPYAPLLFLCGEKVHPAESNISETNNSIVKLKGTSGGGVMAPVYDFIPLHVYWGPSNSKACIA